MFQCFVLDLQYIFCMRYLVYSAYPKFYSASTFIIKNLFIVKISSRETLFKNTENTNKSCWFCDLEMVPVYCNFLSLDYFSNCTDILKMNFPHGLTNWPIPRHSKCQCVQIQKSRQSKYMKQNEVHHTSLWKSSLFT